MHRLRTSFKALTVISLMLICLVMLSAPDVLKPEKRKAAMLVATSHAAKSLSNHANLEPLYYIDSQQVRDILVYLGVGDIAIGELRKRGSRISPNIVGRDCNVYIAIRGEQAPQQIWIAVEYPDKRSGDFFTELVSLDQQEGGYFIGETKVSQASAFWIERFLATFQKSPKLAQTRLQGSE